VCCTINTHPKSAKAVKPLIFNYFLEMGFRWLKLFARHLATGFLSRAWDFDRIAEEQLALPQEVKKNNWLCRRTVKMTICRLLAKR
jgi:hypothetical protein